MKENNNILYQNILNDPIIIMNYKKIDLQNKYPFNHGLQHVKNVTEIMNKLTKALSIVEKEKNNLLIACVLHDIGQVDNRENHGFKSRKFAEEYLKGKVDDQSLNLILLAIENHSRNNGLEKLSLFSNLLCFTDKMDFSKDRLEKDYQEKFGYIVYEDVDSVDFFYSDNLFALKIKTTGKINGNDLLAEENFFHKVIAATTFLANKLSVAPKIYVDDVLLNISNKECIEPYLKKER